MLYRPATDRLIDARILFALARGLTRLESAVRQARLAAWNAAGRAAVASESVGGLDCFAVRMPPRPAAPDIEVSIRAVDRISPALRRTFDRYFNTAERNKR